MTLTKKKPLFLALLASASIILAGCDEFEALPTPETYDAPILNLVDDGLYQNRLGEIYDALVSSGDTNSERVLKNVLYIYATSVYGNFFDTAAADGTVVKGLRSTVESGDEAAIKAFAETYPAYKDKEGKGDAGKVIAFYQDVLYRIRTVFLGYVNDSTYQDRSRFVEKKFYDAQVASYYDLAQEENGIAPYNEGYTQILGTYVLTDVIDEDMSAPRILDGENKDHEGDIANAYFKDIFGTYESYITTAVLPDIYRKELTVEYLYTVNRSTLELSSAREVSYIALSESTAYPGAVSDLLTAYSKLVIENPEADVEKYDLNFLDALYQGYDFSFEAWDEATMEMARQIYDEAGWDNTDRGGLKSITLPWNQEKIEYYSPSALGTILDNLQKLITMNGEEATWNNRFLDDTSIRSDFTNSGAYTVQTGFEIKTNSLQAEDHTTNGWYANSSAMDDSYPLSSVLFDTRVANEVDSVAFADGKYENADLDYGYYRNGNYYLLPETYDTSNEYPYIYLSDGTYYITVVEQAVKRAKVNESYGDQYYDNLPAHADETSSFADYVLRTIGYLLSSSDTWTSSSNSYYVDLMGVIFHDTYVYDYFVSTFPDIYD